MNMNYTNNFNINNIPKELQSCELLNKEILAEEEVLAIGLASRYFSNLF
jgi:hypothetical protein